MLNRCGRPVEVRTGTSHATTTVVGAPDKKKPYIDVMENVFGGVRISTDKEPRSQASEPDLRGRPWLTGVTMSAVQVTLDEDEDEDERKK